jgi:hypothetical protein
MILCAVLLCRVALVLASRRRYRAAWVGGHLQDGWTLSTSLNLAVPPNLQHWSIRQFNGQDSIVS